jgi:hypothetical protein
MAAVPLTYCQRFVYDIVQSTGLGNQISECVHITGPVDPAAFKRAAAKLMTLHPILGSRLEMSDGEPVQRQGHTAPSFKLLDIEGASRQQVDGMLSEHAHAPLNPFSENPLRIVFAYKGGTDESFLLLVAHHIFADEAALQALIGEYLAIALGKPEDPAEASWDSGDRSFLSYALSEQRMISDGTMRRQARYWADHYDQADPVLHLSNRGADPVHQTMAEIPFRLEQDEFRAFSNRARTHQVSHFTIAATAIFYALREVTRQDNILLAVVGDSRRPPFVRTIGQFAAFYIIQQCAKDGGLRSGAVRAIFDEVIQAMQNYSHHYVYTRDIDSLRERIEKGFTMSDAFVNFLPMGAALDPGAAFPRHEISHLDLKPSGPPLNVPYYGLVIGIGLRPEPTALSGAVYYESGIVEAEVADTITHLIRKGLVAKV